MPRKQASKHLLDLGTGSGYFPLTCRHQGLHVHSLDLDTTPLYAASIQRLSIDRTTFRIEPHKPLCDFAQRFDWVTAFQPMFDQADDGGIWERTQWQYFFQDLRNHVLNDRAQLFLGVNTVRSEFHKVLQDNFAFFSVSARAASYRRLAV